jgi:hypothetical protein
MVQADKPGWVRAHPLNITSQLGLNRLYAMDADLLELECSLPPEARYRAFIRHCPPVRGWKRKAPMRVDRVVFWQKNNPIADDLNQPAVVRQACLVRPLASAAGFAFTRWDFNVSFLGDTDKFTAYAEGVAHVLECVRADHEIELLVSERPGSSGTDILLHPGLASEPFPVTALESWPAKGTVKAPGFVWLSVEHPLGAVEGTGPATDIKHQRTAREFAD